jgi:hypothetical protein
MKPGRSARHDYEYQCNGTANLFILFAPLKAGATWHYTPKYGSWLDLAESELGALTSQCLDRRIPDKQTLIEEIGAWERDRSYTKQVGISQRPTPGSNSGTSTFNLIEPGD